MTEELFPLKPGQRLDGIPHKAWNAFVEAARYVKGQKRSLFREALRDVPQTGIVRLRNESGSNRERFDVLGIDDVFPQPSANPNGFKAGPVLHGVTPSEDDHRGRFAILLEPAKSGAIVSACVAGTSVAKVNVVRDEDWIQFADIEDGEAGYVKAQCQGSAKILWRESGTGLKWAVVRLGNLPVAIHGAGSGGGEVEPYQIAPCTSPIYELGIELYDQGLKCPDPGLYQFGFQATLSAPEAPRNAILRMQLFVDSAATPWIGYRENWRRDVCDLDAKCSCDGSPAIGDRRVASSSGSGSGGSYSYYYCPPEIWHTAENVAVSGLIRLDNSGQVLTVRNTGMYKFAAGAFQLWALQVRC